jgi:L-amino acid N-acyltransferase YncA
MDSLPTDIAVRVALPDDAAAFVAIYGPFTERTAVSFEEEPPSVENMRERILATLEWTPWLAATNEGQVMGFAYAAKHRERASYRWTVDVSAYVHEGFRGRGVGRSLYTHLFHILRGQRFRRACAGITLPNEASIALHRAFGFEQIGVYQSVGWKLGAGHDVAWFGRDLSGDDDPQAPVEPIPFSSYEHGL